MLDREMTNRAPPARRGARGATARGAHAPRPVHATDGADAAPRRHEVVVQGMRISLPALRFMEIPPPGPLRR
ncbi:hypothetical protein ACTZWW_15670 [Salinarimonas sp. NSM]|uniref:hypothetical protein n=1 Tax=Salinarimonas sp. NSM TaxID=3458003 RepID=UPI00403676FE